MKKIISFLTQWNELLTIPAAFILWWLSPYFLRWLDPTAGVYDAGIFQVILFAIICFLIFHGVVWLVLKLTFPRLYRFFDDEFEKAVTDNPELQPSVTERDKFFHLNTYQKCVLILFYFSLCLLSMVLLARVV